MIRDVKSSVVRIRLRSTNSLRGSKFGSQIVVAWKCLQDDPAKVAVTGHVKVRKILNISFFKLVVTFSY